MRNGIDFGKDDPPISFRAQRYLPVINELYKLKDKNLTSDEKREIEHHNSLLSEKRPGFYRHFKEIAKFIYEKFMLLYIFLILVFTVLITFEISLDEETNQNVIIILRDIESIILAFFWFYLTMRIFKKSDDTFKKPWIYLDIIVTILISFPGSSIPFLASGLNVDYNYLKSKLRFLYVLQSLALFKFFFCVKSMQKLLIKIVIEPFAKIYIAAMILLIITVYSIFAIYMFKDYIETKNADLKYQNRFHSFSSVWSTMLQIMTFDEWRDIFNDITKIENTTKTYFFFLSWIWIGGFILAHSFIGIYVSNFLDLKGRKEKRRKKQEKRILKYRKNLIEKMELHNKMNKAKINTEYPEIQNIGLALKSQIDKLKQIIKEFDQTQKMLKKDVIKQLDEALSLYGTGESDMWNLKKEDLGEYLKTLYNIVQNLAEGNELRSLFAQTIHEITNQAGNVM
ncbi:hypothetical protein TRFO_23474 [Tritrichomonas foetus]|uniref:Ion transport domain-containing protein n=1 Tax=Tritrichomonas foetus TaxID=1144522 RepID=A0A1J4KB32_9EUKA|nr:hypothetical protein TRFO_23474 [Tritrichomonas foetus]|eukprot:OHT08112.1 hypothetical protein TRFO_23474 [Tritrichomonas foetus]